MAQSVLFFLTAINMLNYLDRYIMAAVLPAVTNDLALSQTAAGFLVSAFVPGYVIFSPIFGYLGDRYNRPRLLALGVFLWSLATILSAVASSFWLMVFARVMVGIGEASFATIGPGYIKDRIKDGIKVNSALSIFFCAIPVGSALGFVLGGALAQRFGWHTAFLAGGVPGLILAPLLLRLLEVRGSAPADTQLAKGVREIWSSTLLRYAIGGYILQAMTLNGVAAFISAYGVSIGFSLERIGTAFGLILVAAGLVGTLLGGRLSSYLAAKAGSQVSSMLSFVGISALIGVPFLFAAFSVENQVLFLSLCFVAEVLIFAGTAPVNAVIVVSAPAAYLTLTQGVTILALNLLGNLPAPPIVGFIADNFSLVWGLKFLCLPLALAGAIWTVGGRKSKVIAA